MPRMYHPDLEPPHNTTDVPDDEGSIRVHAESGWKVEPEPAASSPAHAPTVTYEPVQPESDEDYDSLTKEQLQERLRRRDLAVSGTVAELVARLEDDDASKSTE